MGMIVRFPKFDYSDFKFYWSHNMAFSQDRNATAIIPSPVEPWLIKLLQEAAPLLPPSHTWLRDDTQKFIAQESQHFRQHRIFNKLIAESGFPRLAEMEAELAADLEEFSRTKSLKWRLAYADGFETLGAVSGMLWFEKSDEMIGGLDNAAIRLWKWHMAEEFEHREVCFQYFKAIYCRGLIGRIINGYFYRLYGLIFAIRHLRGFSSRAVAYMRQVEMERMSDDEKRQLRADIKTFERFNRRVFLKPLLANLLPWYDPGKKPVPRGLFNYLKKFEKDGEWSAGAKAA
ncbi:metal-dependent hydrolase [Rhizorhabdus dicambivorans]|uniref:Metal-dependent hydrolase n=1 Tax=Rhizorhabdus dicambivorans TaxID=1850238 RepID=A0A2A4FW69_9SPHN|nr:metal-dependent hydrolase [Rhizorhabdus dicambivorans]ATE65601.1 metal-dependent hydrolase [Rhizorhabdus dicambivorans]PCE41944.1 metal-dependent hydrolase [Rhizorhabdus dicambivorans]